MSQQKATCTKESLSGSLSDGGKDEGKLATKKKLLHVRRGPKNCRTVVIRNLMRGNLSLGPRRFVGVRGRPRRSPRRRAGYVVHLWKVWLCVCVCHNEKVPDEWQAQQAIPAILQVRSSKHNANKNTGGRGPFHQSIAVIFTGKTREAVTNP